MCAQGSISGEAPVVSGTRENSDGEQLDEVMVMV
jgi:hypothetical protein